MLELSYAIGCFFEKSANRCSLFLLHVLRRLLSVFSRITKNIGFRFQEVMIAEYAFPRRTVGTGEEQPKWIGVLIEGLAEGRQLGRVVHCSKKKKQSGS